MPGIRQMLSERRQVLLNGGQPVVLNDVGVEGQIAHVGLKLRGHVPMNQLSDEIVPVSLPEERTRQSAEDSAGRMISWLAQRLALPARANFPERGIKTSDRSFGADGTGRRGFSNCCGDTEE